MKVTIDGAGRIIVPKPLRDQLGLAAGMEIEIVENGGELVLRPVGPRTRVVRHEDGRGVLVADGPVEPLTSEAVRDLIERGRR